MLQDGEMMEINNVTFITRQIARVRTQGTAFALFRAAAVLMLVVLAGCGGTADPPTPTTAPQAADATATLAGGQSGSGAVEVQATLREWGLDLSSAEVSAGTIRFVVNNTGMMAHNFTIKDSSNSELGTTGSFAANQGPKTLEVTLQPGTYTVYCSLPGHAARGQQNTLVVK